MENQVEEIKKKLNIVNVVSKYLPIKKRGRHYLACCPFHNEKTPSFTISEELQIFKCFGCGKAGDIFTFVQEYERVDFKEALETLAKMAGVVLVHSDHMNQEETKRKVLVDINKHVAQFYNFILLNHPLGNTALQYVLKRGITLDTIKKFNIGFSPPNSALITNYLLKKGYKPDQLIATGTFGYSKYGKGDLYDRFQDRLIFPLADARDRILGFSGRILPSSNNPNLAKYINSPETEIYHKSFQLFGLNMARESIRKENAVIVVEGEFDMISPFQNGITNIVAIKGTAFTADQLQLLKRFTDTIILALDSDFAGNNAARKSIELADSLGFDIKVLSFDDKYKDPDEAINADPDFFKSQLQKTLPVWDFLIQSVIKSQNIDTVKGKKETLSILLPFLVKIENSVIRSDYFKKLANELGSCVDAIYQEATKYENKFIKSLPFQGRKFNEVEQVGFVPSSKTEKLEDLLLTLILGARRPSLLAKKLHRHLHIFVTPRNKLIIKNLLSAKKFDPKKFNNKLPAEVQPFFQNLFLEASASTFEPLKRRLEIKKIINQINIVFYKDEINRLSATIAQLEDNDETDELHQAELKYNQLLTKLSKLQIKKS